MKLITYIIASLALLAALFSCQKQTDRPDFGLNEPMDSLFNSLFAPDEPGAVVMVLHNDTLVYNGAFGLADLGTKAPMTDSVMMNISSASKLFITVAIMRLVEDGRLSLSDSLSKFYPQYKNPVFNGITIEHVLSHTTGLPDERPRTQEEWENYVQNHSSAFGYGPDYRLYARGDELIRFFETIDTVNFVPGSKFEYQEAPFLLLPHIIEQVTGKRFKSWMRTNVFDYAGIENILYFSPDADIENMAHAYMRVKPDSKPEKVYNTSKGQWTEADYGEVEFYASMVDVGIYMRPKDLMHWIQQVFNGDLITKESLKNISTPRVATPMPDVSYSLSAYVTENEYEPRRLFHTRRNGGFATYSAMFPDLNLYYFITANRPHWNRLQIAAKVDSILRSHNYLPQKK